MCMGWCLAKEEREEGCILHFSPFCIRFSQYSLFLFEFNFVNDYGTEVIVSTLISMALRSLLTVVSGAYVARGRCQWSWHRA